MVWFQRITILFVIISFVSNVSAQSAACYLLAQDASQAIERYANGHHVSTAHTTLLPEYNTPDGRTLLVWGCFDSEQDAHVVLEDLKDYNLGRFEIVLSDTNQASANGYLTDLRTKFEVMVHNRRAASQAIFDSETDEIATSLDSTIMDKTIPVAEHRNKIANLAASLGDDDQRHGWLELKNAYLSLREGDFEGAERRMKVVAEQDVPSYNSVSDQALLRLGLLYQRKADKLQAYQCYRAITELDSVDPQVRAEATLHRGATLMEIWKDLGIGEPTGVRSNLENLRASLPETALQSRATLGLIHAETYYYDGDYPGCISAATAYLSKWDSLDSLTEQIDIYGSPLNKEIAMCRVFLGMSYAQVGDHESGKAAVEPILEMNLSKNDRWRTIDDIKAHAQSVLNRIEGHRVTGTFTESLN